MRPEYILLICVFILPTIYKLGYWQAVFASRDNDIKLFLKYMKTKQGREKLFHFWIFLEVPILVLSIIPFFSAPFEVFLYNTMFYFGILFNIFVIGKILRKKMLFPKVNNVLAFAVLFLVFDGTVSFLVNEKYLYLFLISGLLFMPLYFLVSVFIVNFGNTKLFKYYK